jgi:SpoVK/Ycf46/Vps4 family AAA+-type ATPase
VDNISPFDTPGARRLTVWTLALANDPLLGPILFSDPHLFGMMYASCAGAVTPPEALTLSPEDPHAVDGERVLATLKDLQREFGERVRGQFAGLYLTGLAVHRNFNVDTDRLMEELGRWHEDASRLASATITSQEMNMSRLADLLSLSTLERDLLSFQLDRNAPGFAQVFDTLLRLEDTATYILASMFGVNESDIRNALDESGILVRSGLLDVRQRPLRISVPSAHLRAVLIEEAADDEAFFARFVAPLRPSPSTASLARLDDRDRDIILRLLRLPVTDSGLHTLIYGPKSVDKIDMLARMLASENMPGYQVRSRNVPPGDMPAWTFIAQAYVEQNDCEPDSVLVVDRAEQALTARTVSFASLLGMYEADDSHDDDRTSDEGLTDSRLRCIWLTGNAGFLTERNLGRFLFHCEAKPGSRADRRDRITAVISEHGLSRRLESELAKYSLLGEQQVRQAATLARLVSNESDDQEDVIRRAVLQSQRALGRDHTEELRDSVTRYSLEHLNITGKFGPDQILKALRKRPVGSICMYGLPGAGKTQLAEFLAVELDMPILMKRASDLLSKWLGESEQNIASMFREAEEEGAILFLDEADSFLRDRALARAEWSVTQVNEILQQMERFSGIFIAATNLMQDVDAAALRRFTFKLEFKALRPEQAWTMFVNESGFDADADADPGRAALLQDQLTQIMNLTPGDFATVKRQANLLDERLDPDTWIEQLAAEAKAKMAGLERNQLGFG